MDTIIQVENIYFLTRLKIVLKKYISISIKYALK